VLAIPVCRRVPGIRRERRDAADSPAIILDQSIGGVAIGMFAVADGALYGSPDSSLTISLRGGGTGLLVRYHVHGGDLIVVFAQGVFTLEDPTHVTAIFEDEFVPTTTTTPSKKPSQPPRQCDPQLRVRNGMTHRALLVAGRRTAPHRGRSPHSAPTSSRAAP
jgi:hypothetical protein